MTTINKLIDHTKLGSDASYEDIEKLAEEAQQFGFNSICIRPQWLEAFGQRYRCSAVIDFPKEAILISNEKEIILAKEIIGNSDLNKKIEEAKQALEAGAMELDPVIRIGRPDLIQEELRAYIELMNRHKKELWLKPIFSCEILTWEEIIFTIEAFSREVSRHLVLDNKSKLKFAYKNSTGFIRSETIELKTTSTTLISFIAEKLSLNDPAGIIRIKAAGGIKDKESAKKIILASQGRLSHIGTSSGLAIIDTNQCSR